jgi:mannose-1-phosphate guanylyltransferase/phosphomannomutase
MQQDFSRYTVMILAAGLGTRLRPVTDSIPKVMVPIAERKPLLEHTICLLREQGFQKFVVNLHYFPQVIKDYFGDGSRFGVRIGYSDKTTELLETAGGIKKAETLLSDPFIVLYGDHLSFFDFRPVLAFHEEKRCFGTLVLKRSDLPQNGDCVEINPVTKKITRWHARPHEIVEFGNRYFLNSGFDIFSKKILDAIPANTPLRLDIHVLPKLVQDGAELYGFPTDDKILDIGTPEKYSYAKTWYAARMKQ